MKVTSHIPDDLYRQVKAKAAHEGRTVREITEALYRAYTSTTDPETRIQEGEAWLKQWLPLAKQAKVAPDGVAARDQIAADRGRLDRS